MPGPGKILIPPEVLDFYKGLKDIQEKYSTDRPSAAEKTKELNWSGDIPLIQLKQPVFDEVRLYELFGEITSLIAARQVKNDIDAIAQLPRQSILNLIEAAINGNFDASGGVFDRNIKIDVLKFVVINCVKPFLKAFAGEVTKEVDIGSWRHNFCPVCGNSPYIGRIAEDGKRYLRCSLCETEWLYKRLACYNCGNENHETLTSLIIEETPGYGLDVCEQCKGYLKIVDEPKGGSVELLNNQAAALYLDVIAQQQGYRSDIANG